MKLIRQLGRVIFTLGAKSGDNKVSITVKPFKILIVVFPTSTDVDNPEWIRNSLPPEKDSAEAS
jgi:hypothetical protein